MLLNDLGFAIELFEKRGSIYSHRPHYPMIGELLMFLHFVVEKCLTLFLSPVADLTDFLQLQATVPASGIYESS